MITLEQILSDDKIIRISDARIYFNGKCIPGWIEFLKTFNYEWKTVVREGIKASDLYQTNDFQAQSLVDWFYNKES